jgi:hypothetical protein
MELSSQMAPFLLSHNFFVFLQCYIVSITQATVILTIKTKEIMNQDISLSIIADEYIFHLNTAIKKVFGVNAAGAVYTEEGELIQSTEP